MACKGALQFYKHINFSSLPFPESLTHLLATTSSCQAAITLYLTLIPSFLPLTTHSHYGLCYSVSFYHPLPPLWRKAKESYWQGDILLFSLRKPETGRRSEQCQQIREVQKPPQEACQSSSVTRASETQGKNKNWKTVQECHPSQQRVHEQQLIKPWFVLFWHYTCRWDPSVRTPSIREQVM